MDSVAVGPDSARLGTGIQVLRDGHLVSRKSDVIFYSVEAKNIDAVVATYGPCEWKIDHAAAKKATSLPDVLCCGELVVWLATLNC